MPLVKTGATRELMAINKTRHMVVWVTVTKEGTVLSTDCGETADNMHDDLVSRAISNCPTCIPFGRTQ